MGIVWNAKTPVGPLYKNPYQGNIVIGHGAASIRVGEYKLCMPPPLRPHEVVTNVSESVTRTPTMYVLRT